MTPQQLGGCPTKKKIHVAGYPPTAHCNTIVPVASVERKTMINDKI